MKYVNMDGGYGRRILNVVVDGCYYGWMVWLVEAIVVGGYGRGYGYTSEITKPISQILERHQRPQKKEKSRYDRMRAVTYGIDLISPG